MEVEEEEKKKVLVTGASGFLGGRLCHALIRNGGYSVRAFVRRSSTLDAMPDGVELAYGDLIDLPSLLQACSGCRAIFHCGALVEPWLPDPSKFKTVNVDGLKNVIDATKKIHSIKVLIYISSFFALGPSNGRVADENQIHPGISFCTEYERSKVLADALARQAAEVGLPIVLVYPGVLYGPGKITSGNSLVALVLGLQRSRATACFFMQNVDTFCLSSAQVLPYKFAFPLFLIACRPHVATLPNLHERAPISLWSLPYSFIVHTPGIIKLAAHCTGLLPGHIGNGKDKLSFCHVDDVSLGCIAAMEKGKQGERYLLTGENASFNELLDIVDGLRGSVPAQFGIPLWLLEAVGWIAVIWARLTGKPPLLSYPMVNVLKKQWAYSHVKARQELGYQPRSFKEGIAELLSWLKSSGMIKR